MGGTRNTGNVTRDKNHIKCFTCNKMRHNALKCHGKGRDDEAHLTYVVEEKPALMMTMSHEGTCNRHYQEDVILIIKERLLLKIYCNHKNGENNNIWYLDNGASNHMNNHREKFQELDESFTGRVKFFDGSTIQIIGKGTIVFKCENGDQKAL